ncbi:hypothetical protein M0802_000505 [Mischocyttarus mexicanus]|nr:hypothetical protein M0802_000505 [Mischocyttarus mexicanus]
MLTQSRNCPTNFSIFKESKNFEVLSSSPTPPPFGLETQKYEVDNQEYRLETNRLKTFEQWPITFIDPKDLAAAGFYYLCIEDRVRCFECKIEVYNWEEGDVPMTDHMRHSPRCRFVRNIPCGNVPIGVDPNLVPPPSPIGHDVCGIYEPENYPRNEYSEELSNLLLPPNTTLRSLGIERPKQPIYLKYASLELRISSFDTWPKPMIPTKPLADAGFFYTGEDDQTLCFHCGVGLKDWELDDDPWQEHLKWFPNCHFLVMSRGNEYTNVEGQSVKLSSTEMKQTSLEESFEDINLGSKRGLNTTSENNVVKDSSSDLVSSTVANKHDLPLKESNKPMDDGRLCKICYNAELGVVFLPCKHMIACTNCASVLTSCAVCRKPIDLVLHAILS